MSYELVDEIFEEFLLTSAEKLVLLVLARHANTESRVAWPSVETIRQQASLSRRTAQRALRDLEKLGVIIDVTSYPDDRSGKRKRRSKLGGTLHGYGISSRYKLAPEDERSRLLVAREQVKYEQVRRGGALKSVIMTH